MSKEWKDAQTEYAREQKMDPYVPVSLPSHPDTRCRNANMLLSAFSFTGVSRADGKGKTYNK